MRRHRTPTAVTVAVALLVAVAATLSAAPASAAGLEGEYDTAQARAEGNSPSLGGKLVRYDTYTRASGGAPDVVVLGTSRAVQLDPRYIAEVSGRSAYNAGISDGAARELLAFSTFTELLHPDDPPHLIVMFDIEAFNGRTPTKRVRTVLAQEARARRACAAAAACTDAWQTAAAEILRSARIGQRGLRPASEVQRPDGMQINGYLETVEREGADLGPVRDRRIALRVRSYAPGGGFDRLEPVPIALTKQLIDEANARGDRPTIVLTSMHPDCIRTCGPAGWNERRRASLATFRTFARTADFTLHDFSDPRTWGGSGSDFFDEIHLRPAGAAKVVRRLDELGAFSVDVAHPVPTPGQLALTILREVRTMFA